MRKLFALLAVGATVTTASAAVLEVEPNNTTATANFVPLAVYAASGGFAFDGAIAPSDVDYVSVNLTAGDYLGVALFTLSGNGANVQLLDPSFAQLAVSTAPIPAFGLAVPATGTYYIGVSGVGDLNFVGQHSQLFTYKLGVSYNAVPEPATLGLLAGAGILALRRKA